jgi:competence protein ComFC
VVSSKLSGSNGLLVPLPTIGRHIRERGFDHIKLIVKNTGLPYETILQRKNSAVQVGASAEKRREQAKTAYTAKHAVNPETEYILFDDVWTTGSSLLAAREVLIKAGAQKVSVAVLAKTVH